jgi:lanosterol synthase
MSGGGMMMNGTNGSQLWDTALLIQGLIESGLASEPQNHEAMKKGLMFLDDCQIRKDPPFMKEGWRDRTLGAWPFSNKWQGYTVSDCTSEGLKAVLLLQGKLRYHSHLISCCTIEFVIRHDN